HHPIGSGLDVDGPEPSIGRIEDGITVLRAHGGTIPIGIGQYDIALEGIECDKIFRITLWQFTPFISKDSVGEPYSFSVKSHIREITKGVRIGKRTVFTPGFFVI